MDPIRDDLPPPQGEYIWQPPPKFRNRTWLHVALFLATVLSTALIGFEHYANYVFYSGDGTLPGLSVLLAGSLWYSASVVAILGAHEFGHYFACRYYDVDASLPYFIPMPLMLTGTLGAVIRIREPIHSKRMLFDIGIAGPIAGFVVAVPCLAFGLLVSNVIPTPTLPEGAVGMIYGEPLIFKAIQRLIWGSIPDGYVLNAHPVVFGAWFGFLATALNLFPIGQLDGGHISYAVLGRKSSVVTLVSVGAAVFLAAFVSATWIAWTVLLIIMLMVVGRHHPRTFDEHIPLDPARYWLTVFAVFMLIVCFIPEPVTFSQILK